MEICVTIAEAWVYIQLKWLIIIHEKQRASNMGIGKQKVFHVTLGSGWFHLIEKLTAKGAKHVVNSSFLSDWSTGTISLTWNSRMIQYGPKNKVWIHQDKTQVHTSHLSHFHAEDEKRKRNKYSCHSLHWHTILVKPKYTTNGLLSVWTSEDSS